MSSVVKINNRPYYIDRRQFTRTRAKDYRNEPDSGERIPEERGVKANELWLRVSNDWSLGAGQELADSIDSSPRRFRSSINFDPFTRGELRVSKQILRYNRDGFDEELISGPHVMASNGHSVFIGQSYGPAISGFVGNYVDGFAKVEQSPGGDPERHFVNAVTVGHGYQFITGTAQGYVAKVNSDFPGVPVWEDIGQVPGGTAITAIGFALGRLVVGVGNLLYEMASDGTCTLIYTHHNPYFEWKGIVESPQGLYLWGWFQIDSGSGLYPGRDIYDGGVFFMSVEEFDGSLAPPYKVLPLPEGEYVYDLIYYGGYVFISTNVGVRMAQVNELGYLVYGPALEIPYAGGLYGRGENIYVGFNSYVVNRSDSNIDNNYWQGIAVIKLRELVDNLTPPFAMVYAYPSNFYDYIVVPQIALDYTDTIFMVNDITSKMDYVDVRYSSYEAYMRMGYSSFGTSEDVRILSAGIKAQTDDANVIKYDVGIRYLHQDPNYGFPFKALNVINDSQGSLVDVNKDCDIRTRRAELAITSEWVNPNIAVMDVESTVYQIQMEASPVHFYSEKIVLPCFFADWIRDDYGLDVSLDLDLEWKILSDLMNARTLVTLKMGEETFRGFIQQLEMRPEALMEYSRAFDNEDFSPQTEGMLSGFVYVTFHTVPGYK